MTNSHKWLLVGMAALSAGVAGCASKENAVTETGSAGPKPAVVEKPAEVAPSPPPPSTAVDLSSPRAALKSFAAALEKGDMAGVKAVSVSDPKADKLLEVVVPMMGAMKKLSDAAVKKFGDAGKTIANDNGKGMEFVKDVDNAKIDIKGDTATAVINDSKQPAKLVKVNGEWKIDFASAMGPEAKLEDLPKITPMFTGMTKAATEGAAEIEAGKYKTADEAKQAVGMKLMSAMFGGMADLMKEGMKEGVKKMGEGGGAQGNPFAPSGK